MLKITTANHLKAASFHIAGTLMMFGCLVWLRFEKDFTFIFSIIWIIYTIPALYLHLEYYTRNKGEAYEINDDRIIRYKNGEEKKYDRNDIERVTVYMAPSMYQRSSLHFLAIESYHYARIVTKTGEELIITCLLAPKVEEALKPLIGVNYVRKKRLFSTLSWK